MKKSDLVKLVKEELKGFSPQIGQTKGLTPDTLNKILLKIAKSGEEEGEVEEGMMFYKDQLNNLVPKGIGADKILDDLIKVMNKFYADHDLDIKVLGEEKPGLWANIRAKRARGEKPAHKNSKAHKDAVAAGKKINAMSEQAGWPEEVPSRYDGEYVFKLIKTSSDRAKYAVIDIETGEEEGTLVFSTPERLQDYANDLIKPQGGRQSSHFGTQESKDVDEDKSMSDMSEWPIGELIHHIDKILDKLRSANPLKYRKVISLLHDINLELYDMDFDSEKNRLIP